MTNSLQNKNIYGNIDNDLTHNQYLFVLNVHISEISIEPTSISMHNNHTKRNCFYMEF